MSKTVSEPEQVVSEPDSQSLYKVVSHKTRQSVVEAGQSISESDSQSVNLYSQSVNRTVCQ